MTRPTRSRDVAVSPTARKVSRSAATAAYRPPPTPVPALMHAGSVAGGFAIYALKIKNGNSNFGKDALYLLILLVALTLCAALYIVAVVLRETGPGGESSDAGKGKGGDAAATGFSWPAFGGGGASAAKDAAVRAAAPAVASALLPSLGQRLFGGGSAGGSNGGGDVESMPAQSPGPSAPPAPGPTADSPEDPGSSGSGSNAKGAVFGSSGGLFGGGKNKYGYANDTPEANPFMS